MLTVKMNPPATGDAVPHLKRREPYLSDLIRRHVPRDKNAAILDLGCGQGDLMQLLRVHGYRNVAGIDLDPHRVEVCRGLNLEARCADLLTVLDETPANSIDCVICFDVLEHLRLDDLVQCAHRVHQVLKPAGRWIVHVPNAESFFGAVVRYSDLTHQTAFTRRTMAELCDAAHFKIVTCYEDKVAGPFVKRVPRQLICTLIRTIARVYLSAEIGRDGRNAILSQNLLAVAIK